MDETPPPIDVKQFFLVFGVVIALALVAANLLNAFITARLTHPKSFIATSTAGGSIATGRYVSPTLQHYVETKLGYALDYPSTWTLEGLLPSIRVAGPVGAAVAPTANLFAAPDRHAYAFVIVGADAITTGVAIRPYKTKDLQNVERGLLLDGVVPLHAVAFQFVRFGGETYVQGSVDVKAGKDLQYEVARMGVRNGRVYIFVTSVTSSKASYTLEAGQTRAILASLTLR